MTVENATKLLQANPEAPPGATMPVSTGHVADRCRSAIPSLTNTGVVAKFRALEL